MSRPKPGAGRGGEPVALPIDAHVPDIVARLERRANLVIVAEPGAGKTTRVPPALLHAVQGLVLVLCPRRVAARAAAQRVADELGEPLGRRVGYQVRLQSRASADTRLLFITEGVLMRRLMDDPRLAGVGAVVLDEFHERRLHVDVALSLLRGLQHAGRSELRLLVMSATLQADPVARYLGAEIVRVPGRPFDVSVEYDDQPAGAPLHERVARAFRRLLRRELEGDALAFLPGAREIRRALESCRPAADKAGVELVPLHGDLPLPEQLSAIRPGSRPKLILSTNVAESSLTVEGVVVVIDSGLERVAHHAPWSGLPVLRTQAVSRASAAQRAGRAGRLRPGVCLRLYTKHEHDGWPSQATPEIQRADLADVVLALSAMQGLRFSDIAWFEPPPEPAVDRARSLLRMLGALDEEDQITEVGCQMAQLPLYPRLSRLALEAARRGCADGGALLAALLSERDIEVSARAGFGGAADHDRVDRSDLLDREHCFREVQARRFSASELRRRGLDAGAVRQVARLQRRLRAQLAELRGEPDARAGEDEEQALLLATCAAFGDRVARRRQRASDEVVLADGGAARLSPRSVVREAEWLVVLAATERDRGVTVGHLASAIEPEWLLELFPGRVRDEERLVFHEASERVELRHELGYGALVLDASQRPAAPSAEASEVLYRAVRERGVGALWEPERWHGWLRRIAYAAERDRRVSRVDGDALEELLRRACQGKTSFAALRQHGITGFVREALGPEGFARVSELAPEYIRLPGGRRLRVHYEEDKPPWVQSWVQDFFGMRETPRLGGEPLVVHLLAPNRRALQVTTDLASFWRQHYPRLRVQLARRYPKHAWPEDPS